MAIGYCRELAERHGIAVGGSSGAVVAAAVSWLRSARQPRSVVCVCPDHGDLYLNSIFDDDWARAHGGLTRTELLAHQP
jgi:cysteine synthase A